jgi:hypothetical protein
MVWGGAELSWGVDLRSCAERLAPVDLDGDAEWGKRVDAVQSGDGDAMADEEANSGWCG